jgi:hypothetical protein
LQYRHNLTRTTALRATSVWLLSPLHREKSADARCEKDSSPHVKYIQTNKKKRILNPKINSKKKVKKKKRLCKITPCSWINVGEKRH